MGSGKSKVTSNSVSRTTGVSCAHIRMSVVMHIHSFMGLCDEMLVHHKSKLLGQVEESKRLLLICQW
jgi:hypothetical protein